MTDFFEGAAHGFLGIFGAGAVYQPVQDAQSAAADAKDALQTTINSGAYQVFIQQDKLNEAFFETITSNSKEILETVNYYNTIQNTQYMSNSYFTLVSFMLIIIIVIFMLVR